MNAVLRSVCRCDKPYPQLEERRSFNFDDGHIEEIAGEMGPVPLLRWR
jgi:hypothetical protein